MVTEPCAFPSTEQSNQSNLVLVCSPAQSLFWCSEGSSRQRSSSRVGQTHLHRLASSSSGVGKHSVPPNEEQSYARLEWQDQWPPEVPSNLSCFMILWKRKSSPVENLHTWYGDPHAPGASGECFAPGNTQPFSTAGQAALGSFKTKTSVELGAFRVWQELGESLQYHNLYSDL